MTTLPTVTRLDSAVTRILGLNPGPFTLQGTNTYLVGTSRYRLLVDTGDGQHAAYFDLVQQRLDEEQAELSDILLTHWHRDHVGGVRELHQRYKQVRFHKLPHAMDAPIFAEHDIPVVTITAESIAAISTRIGLELTVLPTPGHTADHIAVYAPSLQVIFTGDCVLGSGTAVFDDLRAYLNSLRTLCDLQAAALYPGHGPIIDGKERVHTVLNGYITHRMEREQQILALLRQHAPLTAVQLMEHIYTDVTDPGVRAAAVGGVLLHLQKLQQDGVVAIASSTTALPADAMQAAIRERNVAVLGGLRWQLSA